MENDLPTRREFLLGGVLLAASGAKAHDMVEAQAGRSALLIGVSAYAQGGPRYMDLHAANDIEVFSKLLREKFGFTPEQIKVCLSKTETTHAALVHEFQALTERVKPGDTVFVHYSGHGAYKFDRAGRKHYTLVPSDWRMETATDPEAHNELTDTQLTPLVQALKDKVGTRGSLLMTFDCCHSGHIVSNVRGAARVRGVVAGYEPKPPQQAMTTAPVESIQGVLKGSRQGYTAVLACRSDQKAAELELGEIADITGGRAAQAMGRFTYFLVQALREAGARTTYQEVIETVQARMVARFGEGQLPLIEGEVRRPVLGGAAVPLPTYVPVQLLPRSADPKAPRDIALAAGRIQGVSLGSVYQLYPAGTQDFTATMPLTSLRVVDTELTRAWLEPLDQKPLSQALLTTLVGAWAVEKEHRYDPAAFRLNIASLLKVTEERAVALRAALATLSGPEGLVTLIPEAGKGGDAVLSLTKEGFELRQLPDNALLLAFQETRPTPVRELLQKAFLRFQLRQLEGGSVSADAEIRVELRMVPCSVKRPEGYNDKEEDPNHPMLIWAGDLPQSEPKPWRIGKDWFTLQVRNRGTRSAYVTVIDIDSQGGIFPLFPNESDNSVLPLEPDGKWRTVGFNDIWIEAQTPATTKIGTGRRPFGPGDPVGTELIKAFALPQKIDLRPVFEAASANRETRAGQHPLGKLLRQVQNGKRDGVMLSSNEAWSTSSISYTVVR